MAVPLVGPKSYGMVHSHIDYNRSGGNTISLSRDLWDSAQPYRLHIGQVAVQSVGPETYGILDSYILC